MATGQLEERSRVGATRRPAEHEVDGFGLLKQRHGNLARRQALSNMTNQKVDDRGATKRSRDLLPEGSQPLNQLQAG